MLVASALLSQALAHRLPVTVVTVERLDDGRLGITHRLHAHDAVAVLARDASVKQPEIESLKARAKIALYVEEHFKLGLADENSQPIPLPLSLVGVEVESDYLFVYQETDKPVLTESFYVQSGLMREIGDNWLSHVNFETTSTVRSVTFSEKPKWKFIKP